jgi:predicted RNA-binding protein YlqC (UPF0109 family)
MHKVVQQLLEKLSFVKKMDKNTVLVGVAIIAIIITGVLIFAKSNPNFSIPNIFGKSTESIAKAAIDYINNNKLSQTPASLVSTSVESGLVKIRIKIGEQEFDSYISKDGRFLFPQPPIDMNPPKENKTAGAGSGGAEQTAENIQKSDNPVLEAYIVSDCPFGLQIQRAAAEAVKNIPSLAASVKMRYIGEIVNGKVEAMHGEEEAAENLRQICLREEQPNLYWNYVSCYMKKASGKLANGMPKGDSAKCLAQTGVNTAKLNSCMSDSSRGLAFAQNDFNLSNQYRAQSSPTLILGGAGVSESSFGGRSADAIRAIVCAASNTQPSFCSQKLNTAAAAASFSETYSSASGSNSAASCAPAQ